jgi:hypothetical protein
MQFFVSGLIQVFWYLLGAGVWYVIKLIGFGVVTYTGLNFLTDGLMSYIQANLDGLPVSIVSMLSLLGIDKAFNILFTVFSIRLIHMGVSKSGSTTKPVWSKPADLNVTNGIFKA